MDGDTYLFILLHINMLGDKTKQDLQPGNAKLHMTETKVNIRLSYCKLVCVAINMYELLS